MLRLSNCVAFRCSSELEAKGTEFYGETATLIATKEPPSSTNQPGHWTAPAGPLFGKPENICRFATYRFDPFETSADHETIPQAGEIS
jgi:hypothetical protein